VVLYLAAGGRDPGRHLAYLAALTVDVEAPGGVGVVEREHVGAGDENRAALGKTHGIVNPFDVIPEPRESGWAR
jgi:hypothetical protein